MLQGRNSGTLLKMRLSIACAPDYYGEKCERYCKVSDTSKNQGKCNKTTGIKTCNQGWTGKSCEIAICSSSCNTSHANCSQPGECNCYPGWTDGNGTTKTCDTCIEKLGCVNGKCMKGNDCVCNNGWTGEFCEKAVCSTGCDLKHANCTQPGECNCYPGWRDGNGTTKTCDTCIEKHGCVKGKCMKGNDCVCSNGWTGEFCEKAVCSAGCDLKHANCTQPGECKCYPGWRDGNGTTKTCDTCIEKHGCVNGKCMKGNDCVCSKGWTGEFCKKAVCSAGCDLNHANCTQPGECNCHPGWKDLKGTNNTCSTCITASGCVHGKCVQGNDCVCNNGWKGAMCDEAICSSGCDSKHGRCIAPEVCKCHPGWKDGPGSKNSCNTCIPKPGCVNGKCTYGNDCDCNNGWNGTLCDKAICSPGCDLQHGSCTVPDTCKCQPGWKDGPGSKNTCSSCITKKGCVNGFCANGNDCICRKGWKGDLCEIAICSPGCDSKHGSCKTPGTCICQSGWKDGPGLKSRCDTCMPKLGCVNGKCIKGNDCVCNEGWKGDLCDITIEIIEEHCMTSYCNTTNTKECFEKENITKCTCRQGWEGMKCDIFNSTGHAEPSHEGGILPEYIKIGALGLAGIVVLLIIATIVVSLFCRKNQRSRLESNNGSGVKDFNKVYDGVINETFQVDQDGVNRSLEMRPTLYRPPMKNREE